MAHLMCGASRTPHLKAIPSSHLFMGHTHALIFFFFRQETPSISEYQAIVISNHAPVLMTLRIPTSHTNYCPGHLNTLFLFGACFVNFISTEITSFLNITRPQKCLSQQSGNQWRHTSGDKLYHTVHNNARLEQLTNDILKLDATLALAPSNDLVKQRLVLQTEFNLLSTRQNLINKTRSGINEFGEKTGKILAHQLHCKTADRIIAAINDELGTKHIDHSDISICFHKFSEKLYTTKSIGDNNLFDSFFWKTKYSHNW